MKGSVNFSVSSAWMTEAILTEMNDYCQERETLHDKSWGNKVTNPFSINDREALYMITNP